MSKIKFVDKNKAKINLKWLILVMGMIVVGLVIVGRFQAFDKNLLPVYITPSKAWIISTQTDKDVIKKQEIVLDCTELVKKRQETCYYSRIQDS
jgi:hypothetical protein